MTYANIQLPDNTHVDPFLAELVNKLALDMPSITFSMRGKNKREVEYATNNKSLDGKTSAPDGGVLTRNLRVYAGAEFLGEVYVTRRYGGRQTMDVYSIISWRIENQRSPHNESQTSNLGSATRICKRVFIPMNVSEMMLKADSTISSNYVSAIRDLMRPIQHGSLIPTTVVMQQYMYLTVRGEPVPTEISDRVEQDFKAERYEKAMSEFLLAEKFTKIKMSPMVQYNNIFVYRRHSEKHETIEQKEYSDLPIKVQEAIAVLQLMEDNEIVDNVGYRYNDTHFFLIDKLFD